MLNRIRITFKRVVLVSLVGLLVASGWYGWGLYRNIAKATGGNLTGLADALSGSDLKTTDGRTTILLAGYSADDPGHSGSELTDSIMLISIDQTDNSVAVISIPRDLYVDVDGLGYSKINAAYQYGEAKKFSQTGYANGGMGLLEKTVQQNLGIHSDYQALINYQAFKDLVDAVGGVTVTVQSGNAYGLYDPNANLKLANGTQNLDGQTALDLSRARGAGYGSYGFANGDFTRTQNQQMILLALKQKIGSSISLGSLSGLSSAVGNNVKTDLQLGELRTMYDVLKKVDNANIKTYTLNDINDVNLLRSYTTRDGQSALIPAAGLDQFTTIQSTLDGLLQASRDTTPTSTY